eukprot:257020_1
MRDLMTMLPRTGNGLIKRQKNVPSATEEFIDQFLAGVVAIAAPVQVTDTFDKDKSFHYDNDLQPAEAETVNIPSLNSSQSLSNLGDPKTNDTTRSETNNWIIPVLSSVFTVLIIVGFILLAIFTPVLRK